MGLEPKQYEIIEATVAFLAGTGELGVFMRDNSDATPEDLYFSRLKDFEKSHYLQALTRRMLQAFEVFTRFKVLATGEFRPGATEFMGVDHPEVLKNLERVYFKNGADNPNNKAANLRARLYRMFSLSQDALVEEVAHSLS